MSPPAICCAAGAADAELEAFQVGDGLDRLAEPAAHLGARIAGQNVDDVVFLVELAHQLEAAGVVVPRVLLARIEAERNRGAEGESLILAEIVVRRRVAAFHRAVLDGIEHLQAADDFACREQLDVEFTPGRRGDPLTDQLGAAVQRVQTLGPACGHAPVDGGLRLRDCRCCDGAGGDAGGGLFQE